MSRDVTISKALSYFLRHGAQKSNLEIDDRGFIKVADLLAHQNLKSKKTTLQDILRVVETNEKKRFALEDRNGELYICATQGHLIHTVTEGNLRPRDEASLPKQIIHGTRKRALEQIRKSGGLSKMGRNHIHCTSDHNLVSGFRSTSDTLIYIDGVQCLRDGIKFFQSSNGVILSPGNDQGVIECKYFAKVTDRNGQPI